MKKRKIMVVLACVGRSLRRVWHADHSLSARARGVDRLMDVVLAVGMVLFGMGITLPVMTVTELWVFENEFSILGGIRKLWFEDEALLAGVVAAFSIAFPVIKITLAWGIWHHADATRPHFRLFLKLLAVSGRWSMADVFIIATAIMIAKIAGFADATSEPGLYYFMGSLALLTGATLRIERAGEK
ncbi:MAG: paraquat-inducible protein A, partial [Proteobacteria bacterium]|nr:paraquat-inducible protein A [Pseudomonadota bacterium]